MQNDAMVWPFRRPKSAADAAFLVIEDAIAHAAEQWSLLCDALPLNEHVPLADRVAAFRPPLESGLAQRFPALIGGGPSLMLIVIALGIEQSGTHSRVDLERALLLQLPQR